MLSKKLFNIFELIFLNWYEIQYSPETANKLTAALLYSTADARPESAEAGASLAEPLSESSKRACPRQGTDSLEPPTKKCPPSAVGASARIRSKAFSAERQGERDSMQDRHVIIEDFKAFLSDPPSDL